METGIKLSMPAISVIIPVYNSERFLERSIDSAFSQTLSDLEIVCVDDSSTDGSADILARKSKEDSRLRVITLQENLGAGMARNRGLEASRGDYVFFLDSDDWMDPDYLESMYSHALATGQDVVVNANYIEEFEDPKNNKKSGRFQFVKEGDGFYPPYQVQRKFMCSLWTRLYRRGFLNDNNIRFLPGKGGGEDVYFVGLAEMLQERSYIFCGPYYHYYNTEGSLSRSPNIWFQCFKYYKALFKELQDRSKPLDTIQVFLMRLANLDTQSKYNEVREFLLNVSDLIHANLRKYDFSDLVFVDSVLECHDLEDFKAKYKSNYIVSFVKRHANFQKKVSQIKCSPSISVIIPVYNTVSWLDRCLESVLGQSFQDIEVLCVDDCSTDGSWEILQKWSERDNRVVIISLPENRGVSAARNAGIDAARAPYLGFVDSDDTIDKFFYARLLSAALNEDADICKGVHLNYDPIHNRTYQQDVFKLNDKIQKHKAWFYFSFYSALYKTEFIRQNNLRFMEDLSHFEDPVFSVQAAIHCNKISIVEDAKYYYTERPDSMMRGGFTKRHVSDLHVASARILGILEKEQVSDEHYQIIYSFLAGQLIGWVEKQFVDDSITIEAVSAFVDLVCQCRDPRKFLSSYYLDKKRDSMMLVLNNIRKRINA